ncbi:MAG: hypothetical protein VB031_08780 [Eubacteriaceae bacterium]|nr:hypothetical protein [Eubacteriaceae bacterium]
MKKVLDYLQNSLDANAKIKYWNAKEYLNIQLAGGYEYYFVEALDESFLLIKPLNELTIPKAKIQMKRIQEKAGYEVAMLLDTPTAYKMKKMLEERIAFVTIDKQMYLPFMAVHIKRNKEQIEDMEDREKFTALTQMIYLAVLYSDKAQFVTEELSKTLDVSNMTVLRAMEELQRIRVIDLEVSGKTGRKKIYEPIDRREYYRIGKKYLIDPVKKSWYVNHIPDNIQVYKAGETALAEQTMLGEPSNEIFATNAKATLFEKVRVTKAQALMEGLPQIQIMQYDISKLTHNQYVDPVSLIMSIDKKDDRTGIAIDELMEGTVWYEE